MLSPGEQKTVQARILEYAEAIGWTFASQKEAAVFVLRLRRAKVFWWRAQLQSLISPSARVEGVLISTYE